MLLTKKQVLHTYGAQIPEGEKLPGKGKALILCSAYSPESNVIYWTDRKSPTGDRLYNCGIFQTDGTQPPLFSV